MSSWESFKSKKKLKNKKEELRKRRRKSLRNMPNNSDLKFKQMMKRVNKIDLITLKKAEKSDKRLKMRRERLKLSNRRNLNNWTILKFLRSTKLNLPRKRSYDETIDENKYKWKIINDIAPWWCIRNYNILYSNITIKL